MVSYIVIIWLLIVSAACITSMVWYNRKLNRMQRLVEMADADLVNDFIQVDMRELSETSIGQELLALLRKEHPQIFEKFSYQETNIEQNADDILTKLKDEQLQLQRDLEAINKLANESSKKWMLRQQSLKDSDDYRTQGDEKRSQP
jgi:hypothetical protein